MAMIDDAELLRRYVETRDEGAFAELVRRHLNLVYAAALRRLGGNVHAASDLAQQVFTQAAHHARSLSHHPCLTSWLYTVTRNAASNVLRNERRRRERERSAFATAEIFATEAEGETDWTRLRPVLDAAMDELRDGDREAVLLRFFQGRAFAEIGAHFRIGENAARMRVERALEKLRRLLARRGVTSTAAALGAVLTQHTGAMVPNGLVASVTNAALAATAGGVLGTTLLSFVAAHQSMLVAAGIAVAALALNVSAYRVNRRLQEELSAAVQSERAFTALRTQNRELMAAIAQRPEPNRPSKEREAHRQRANDLRRAGYFSLSSGGRQLLVTPKTPREHIIEFLHPGGLSSPMRAWQTMLSAGRGPDLEMELLEATFCFDDQGQARLDAFLAALPEAARSNFRNGKSLVAPLVDEWLWNGDRPRGYSPRRDVPVPNDPSRADAYFRVTYASGKTREDRFPFKRFEDGWRYGPLSESDAEQFLALLDPITGLPKQPTHNFK